MYEGGFFDGTSYVSLCDCIIIRLINFYVWVDKQQAIKQQWRISEKTLFILAIFGGAIGGVFGMYLFRHKTKHNKFAFGFPLLAAVHVCLYIVFNYYNVVKKQSNLAC